MDLLAELAHRRLLAIVRAGTPDRLVDVVRTLVGCGIALVELPLTTPGALDALRGCADIPEVLIGAGTVRSAKDAAAVVAAGARYLVTPAVVPEVLEAAAALGVPVLCGAFTASEALAAVRGGATAVKIFPASVAGPAYLSALLQPLPDVPLGAIAVGIGSPLVADACDGGSLDALAERARALIAATA